MTFLARLAHVIRMAYTWTVRTIRVASSRLYRSPVGRATRVAYAWTVRTVQRAHNWAQRRLVTHQIIHLAHDRLREKHLHRDANGITVHKGLIAIADTIRIRYVEYYSGVQVFELIIPVKGGVTEETVGAHVGHLMYGYTLDRLREIHQTLLDAKGTLRIMAYDPTIPRISPLIEMKPVAV